MATALTGLNPKDTYQFLLKIHDSLTSSLKVISDGLGNEASLKLSTTEAEVNGKLKVAAAYGGVSTGTDEATITFDMDVANTHQVELGGNRTLAVSNDDDGQAFTIIIKQDAVGSRTVTWWSGIRWAGGTTPTLTTTAEQWDVFSFKKLASGQYLGWASLNH